jgi:uncharacterized RDD family membrane protein YckC
MAHSVERRRAPAAHRYRARDYAGFVSQPSTPQPRPEPEPLRVDTARVLLVGMGLWLVALVLTLLVPALHEGERDWWPWVCVSGLVGGALALAYVRRGRGNAEAA